MVFRVLNGVSSHEGGGPLQYCHTLRYSGRGQDHDGILHGKKEGGRGKVKGARGGGRAEQVPDACRMPKSHNLIKFQVVQIKGHLSGQGRVG